MKVGAELKTRYNLCAIAMAIPLWGRTGFDGGMSGPGCSGVVILNTKQQ